MDTPAGWYPNPENPRTERWWDGNNWTDHTRNASVPNPPPPSYASSAATTFAGRKPDNLLVWSILATLFCCLPFGIVAIVQSSQVDSKWSSGDHQGAHAAAEKAKQWVTVSVIAGLVVAVVWFLVAMGGADNDPTYGY